MVIPLLIGVFLIVVGTLVLAGTIPAQTASALTIIALGILLVLADGIPIPRFGRRRRREPSG